MKIPRRVIRLAFTFFWLCLFIYLHAHFWFGDGGLLEWQHLQRLLAEQRAENAHLKARNKQLTAEVLDLKQGTAAIEERARLEFGLIKKGETFYQFIESPTKK